MKRMNAVLYKGYEIHPAPYQLRDSGDWTISIEIWLHTGSELRTRNFSAANTFRTKDEAIQHCINFGKQIIDGKLENLTVTDL